MTWLRPISFVAAERTRPTRNEQKKYWYAQKKIGPIPPSQTRLRRSLAAKARWERMTREEQRERVMRAYKASIRGPDGRFRGTAHTGNGTTTEASSSAIKQGG